MIGNDLRWLLTDPTLARLDWSGVGLAHGRSAAFTLAYDTAGDLTSLRADHGVATGLTRPVLARHPRPVWTFADGRSVPVRVHDAASPGSDPATDDDHR